MTDPENPSQPANLADEFAAAMEWWREAGVDADFAEDATDWLAQPEPEAKQEPARKPRKKEGPVHKNAVERLQAENLQASIGGERERWPTSLDGFAEWWLTEPSLTGSGGGARIAPRGPAGAELMVLVPEPEAQDTERLLSGEDGRMLDAILSAMQIEPATVYVASALPSPVPMADWSALAQAGMAQITAHHIFLAAPKRVLILGSGILPLLGHDTAQGAASLRDINHEGGSVSAMAARTLGNLRNLPGERARFWRRWLQWMDA